MIGQIINNYILERKLGEGGMGAVYFARHNRIERVVAIKVLHQALFTQTNIRNRFKNEANALIKLGHPNIVKIYDYIEQDDLACLIMEYIEGYTLDDYLTKMTGPLPGPKATGIIISVLDAVQYAHEKNIFHRDIKPGNIMVSQDGKTVKIMDFGIAKLTDASNLKTTHANAQLGTPFYMSPEQVKGLPYTAASDIYSLGVTLFEMVTGRCPYQEITNLFELQSKIVNEPLPPTGNYYPEVTPKIQQAIKIATSKQPEQRFKNCGEFKNYLLEIEKTQPATVLKQTPPKQAQQQQPLPGPPKAAARQPQYANYQEVLVDKKKNGSWVYLVVILGVLILAGIAYSSLNQSKSPIRPPKAAPAITPVKQDEKSDSSIKAPVSTAGTSGAAIIKPATNGDNDPLSDARRQRRRRRRDSLARLAAKTQTPVTNSFQNVKDDVMRYLGARTSFGGIKYKNANEITIDGVSYKGTDELGNKGYDLNITINGEGINCQVVYMLNGKPNITALK